MASVLVRDEIASDRPLIFEIHAAAFPTPGEACLVDRLREDGDLVLSLVAAIHGVVAGHAGFSRMRAPFRALGLGPVGVAPHHQGYGVGAALIRAGLKKAAQQGWQAVFVLGDARYYQRFGFSRALASGFSCRFAGPHFMALSLRGDALPQLHGDIAYPKAFEALE